MSFEFELDLEELPPKLLRKIIRAGMGKRAKKKMEEARRAESGREDEDEDDIDDLLDGDDESEEERKKQSEEVERQRGKAPSVEVTKDDLPPGIGDKLAKRKKSS